MLTEKQQIILNVLKVNGCLTAKEISNFINRKYKTIISTSSVAGILRPWIARGLAADSSNGQNGKVYWLTDYGKEFFK